MTLVYVSTVISLNHTSLLIYVALDTQAIYLLYSLKYIYVIKIELIYSWKLTYMFLNINQIFALDLVCRFPLIHFLCLPNFLEMILHFILVFIKYEELSRNNLPKSKLVFQNHILESRWRAVVWLSWLDGTLPMEMYSSCTHSRKLCKVVPTYQKSYSMMQA